MTTLEDTVDLTIIEIDEMLSDLYNTPNNSIHNSIDAIRFKFFKLFNCRHGIADIEDFTRNEPGMRTPLDCFKRDQGRCSC